MKIIDLVERIKQIPNCKVYEPKGMPMLDQETKLPDDLKEFYQICGGVELYNNEPYAVRIVSPDNFIPADPEILGQEFYEFIKDTEDYKDCISQYWYIICDDFNGDYFTIDLNEKRLGFCYDSFHETHCSPGDEPIIALSFTDLLVHLIDNKGGRWYWLDEKVSKLGDAWG